MATPVVKANFTDPKYKNWLKVGMALQLTTKAITPFCKDVIESFHKSLKTSIGSNVCGTGCTNADIKKMKITCRSNVCDKWLSAIVPELATSQYSWRNTTVSQWPVVPWQVANIFMGPGQDPTNANPLKTDPAGILQLAINCKQFHHLINTVQVRKVREVRNAVMHCADFKFADADMKTHLQCMIDLLQDPALRTYTGANSAITNIKQIENAVIDISDDAVLQHERNIWKTMIAAQTTNRKEMKKIIDSNKNLQKRLGDVYTKLKLNIDAVKRKQQETDFKVEQGSQKLSKLERKQQETDLKVEQGSQKLLKVELQVLEYEGKVRELTEKKTKSEAERKTIDVSVKDQLRAKYRDSEKHTSLDETFVELRLQKFQQESLPETLTYRDVEELERRRRSSPVVPLVQLFCVLKDDKVAPKKVLIRGRAGVGKTTLVEYIAREWAAENLWPDIDHVFVIKLRELLEDERWSLVDLLLADMQLAIHEKSTALNEICRNSERVLLLVDGLDEYPGYQYSKCRFPIEHKVDWSNVISSIISGCLLPEAKVVVTSRPTNQIPSMAFGRVVDVYGFTRDGINQYVDRFCASNKQLRQFIWTNIDSNPNMATFCHTPVQCSFVCRSLEDMFEHSETGSVPDIKTMTQLYVKATHRLGWKLHPSLKYDDTDPDLERIFSVLKEPFLKHTALAKDCMTTPLTLIFYDDDLKQCGFEDVDKQTGFLSGSKKTDPDNSQTKRNSWSFSHLTLQEFFAAFGLLQGSRCGVWMLLQNENFVKQYEIVITFLCGLLGDPRNVYYLKYLGSTDVSLDFCKEFTKTLKGKLENDPFKMVSFIYETQCKELVSNLPKEIQSLKIYPMEMLSLCWVLEQETCPVTSLDITGVMLDIHLAKQLSEALKENSTIRKLILSGNGAFAEDDVGRLLGAALASMSQLFQLEMDGCGLTITSLPHIIDGMSPGCPQMKLLNLSNNAVFAQEAASRLLGAALESMSQLRELEMLGCHFTLESLRHIIDGISRWCPLIDRLVFNLNNIFAQKEAGRFLGAALASMFQLRVLEMRICKLTLESISYIIDGISRGCHQIELLNCQANDTTDDCKETFKTLLSRRPLLTIQAGRSGLSAESEGSLKAEFGDRFKLM